jgi:hypothetical protein
MTLDLERRLRRANPVPASREDAPEELLRRLVAQPRVSEPPTRRRSRRHPAVLLAAGIIVLGGTAAGISRFAVDYFGSEDAEPTPAAVIAEIRSLGLAAGTDLGTVEAESFVRLASFDGPDGRVTIYIAGTVDGDGYCIVSATGSTVDGGSCGPTAMPEMAIPYSLYWNSNEGEARILYGRLPVEAAAIDVRFENGAVRAAAKRESWWIYVVGGEETSSGRRPTGLVALRADGGVARRQEIDPYAFWSKEEFEAAVPRSDGSPGQDAVRAAVLGLGPSGGRAGTDLQLDKTYLVRRVRTARGSFDVYAAPTTEGRICFGYADNGLSFEHTTSGCPLNSHVSGQGETFKAAEIQVYAAPGGFATVDGLPPQGAAKITVAFEDGTTSEADISTRSYFAMWFDSDRLAPGRLPESIIAWNAKGEAIDAFDLDPAQLKR